MESQGTNGKYAKGLEGVIIGESKKSFIDGEKGYLAYSGIQIEELAENSTYEEVCFLLLHDRLPSKKELRDFKTMLYSYREIPDLTYELIERTTRYGVHPMTVLRLAVDTLAVFDEETEINTEEANYRKALKLVSKVHTITAAIGRVLKGEKPIRPKPDISCAANWLWMYRGEIPPKEDEKIFDVVLIVHAEHEINASTFSARVVISSLTDIYSATSAAIGSLKGPLHGGANEQVMEMLTKEITPETSLRQFIEKKLKNREKIPGFGHRVYKNYDPRAAIFKKLAENIAKKNKDVATWISTGEEIEKIMIETLKEKRIYPNVDFYSGIVMYYIGISIPMFTPIFATGRIIGWVAHILEQLKDNRIYRPRIIYSGEKQRVYIPIDARE